MRGALPLIFSLYSRWFGSRATPNRAQSVCREAQITGTVLSAVDAAVQHNHLVTFPALAGIDHDCNYRPAPGAASRPRPFRARCRRLRHRHRRIRADEPAPRIRRRSWHRRADRWACDQRLCAGRGRRRTAARGGGRAPLATHLADRADGAVRHRQSVERDRTQLWRDARLPFHRRAAAWRLFRDRLAGRRLAGPGGKADRGVGARAAGVERRDGRRGAAGQLAGSCGRLALGVRACRDPGDADGGDGRRARPARHGRSQGEPLARARRAQAPAGVADPGRRRDRFRRDVRGLCLSRIDDAGGDRGRRGRDTDCACGVRRRHGRRQYLRAAPGRSRADANGGGAAGVERGDAGLVRLRGRPSVAAC